MYNPTTLEVVARGSEGQGRPWLHSKFQSSLGYRRHWKKGEGEKRKRFYFFHAFNFLSPILLYYKFIDSISHISGLPPYSILSNSILFIIYEISRKSPFYFLCPSTIQKAGFEWNDGNPCRKAGLYFHCICTKFPIPSSGYTASVQGRPRLLTSPVLIAPSVSSFLQQFILCQFI